MPHASTLERICRYNCDGSIIVDFPILERHFRGLLAQHTHMLRFAHVSLWSIAGFLQFWLMGKELANALCRLPIQVFLGACKRILGIRVERYSCHYMMIRYH